MGGIEREREELINSEGKERSIAYLLGNRYKGVSRRLREMRIRIEIKKQDNKSRIYRSCKSKIKKLQIEKEAMLPERK